jgi:hypothetical protein
MEVDKIRHLYILSYHLVVSALVEEVPITVHPHLHLLVVPYKTNR